MKKTLFGWLAVCALLFLFGVCACAETAENITDQCRFKVSDGSPKFISDVSIDSYWKPSTESGEVLVQLPDATKACWIQINWLRPPENYLLEQYDANKNVLWQHGNADDSFACISDLHEVAEGARYIRLSFTQEKQAINKIRVFGEGELPNTVVKWEPPHEKAELMVISTHQDDEWLWFGGIIPYYDVVAKRDVQVVYMANCGRLRYAEALNALAVAGVRTYPVFMGFKDEKAPNHAAAVEGWGGEDALLGAMCKLIRRFKPEVILTHDWNGEYTHYQHIATTRCMEDAIARAADPAAYPETAAEYGTWQVKKLYRHLETKGRIEFNWKIPYEELGGRTALEAASDAMNQNASQQPLYYVEDHGEYDNALFGLSYSTVGDDVLHEDLFENIVTEPEATPEPEAIPEPEATPEPEAIPVGAEKRGISPILIIAIILVALAAAWFFLVKPYLDKRRRRRRVRRTPQRAPQRTVQRPPQRGSARNGNIRR